MEKNLYDIQRCVLLHVTTNLTILLKITREKHTTREVYLETSHTSNMELFEIIINNLK